MNRSLMTPLSALLLTLAVGLCLPAVAQELGHLQMEELDEAELFFEENTTDEDLGIHFKVDGDGWKRILLFDPDWRPLLGMGLRGNLRTLGLTELFSESREPEFDEVPRDEFLAMFPPGDYTFLAMSIDHQWYIGETELTHGIPAPAEIVWPEEDVEVSPDEDLEVVWALDAGDGASMEIEYIEVVVEKDEDDEMLRVYTVHMLPEDTSVRVPAEFFEAGKDYKTEILVQETSGNRASSEVPFATEETP